ncbi:hypothetical protein HD806DRAFT_230929 [Xylariaceae sp. AK1471]|nr:hypothetical protein HD806DRAFT_230929 [Xylariaceae sp. AK1471]
MCLYVLFMPLCAHSPTLLAGPSCRLVEAELSRIHSLEAWTTPEVRAMLPFSLPDACLPSEANVRIVDSGKWCGWECRNTFDAAGLMEGAGDITGHETIGEGRDGRFGMGVPGATYGVERKGVGWRD